MQLKQNNKNTFLLPSVLNTLAEITNYNYDK